MKSGRSGNLIFYLLVLLSALGYFYFAYYLDRTNFYELIGLYTALFAFFILLFYRYSGNSKHLPVVALLLRIIFILALPNLSQDYYRFIWDGRMIWSGLNPYLFTPESFLLSGDLPFDGARELIDGMGGLSASNHSNYPPLNQLCFLIATGLSQGSILGSVVLMRLIIIGADIGTFFFGKKLLGAVNLPEDRIWLLLLNPFIIIELTGNLHFEGVMVFFLVYSLYLLHKGRLYWSAIAFACSVSVKLIPLMFLPLFIQRLKFKSFKYYGTAAMFLIISFLPFLSANFLDHFLGTIGLWFQKFEFNASLYYLAREIGYGFRGYNEIEIIGSYIPYVVIVVILLLTFFRDNRSTIKLIAGMVLALSIYFFTSTTVHPWYIATLLALSIFTRFRFPLAWSFLIMLSYWAYSQPEFQENQWLISLEYGLVFAWLLFELFGKKIYFDEGETPFRPG